MFEIRLEITAPLERSPFPNCCYDDTLDDYRSVLSDICDLLEDTRKVQFVVLAFDDMPWRVDCRTDLLVIMEQMPEIITALSMGTYDFRLDFYEQGIERDLIFKEKDDVIDVTCISRTAWVPNSEVIALSKETTTCIIYTLYEDFISAAFQVCPALCQHSLMRDFLMLMDRQGHSEK